MLSPLSPLVAYRADRALYPGREELSAHDNEWIIVAHAIHRLADIPREERTEYAQKLGETLLDTLEFSEHDEERQRTTGHFANAAVEAASLRRLATALGALEATAGVESVYEAYFRVVEQIEDAGAFHVSFGTLSDLRQALSDADVRLHGRALVHQARIARQLGDLACATELCEAALKLAHERQDPEIAARATCGMGGLALMRGNHPEARAQYERALNAATLAGVSDVMGLAHRGLLVVHATAGDHDEAIRHGWHAFQHTAGNQAAQAELLANVAAVCDLAGHHGPAFAGYAVSALWARVLRVRLPSLAGAALSAANLGLHEHVHALGRRVEHEISSGAPPYESAQALLDIARAYRVIDHEASREYARRVVALADAYSFFEMQFAAAPMVEETPKPADTRRQAPVELSTDSANFLSSITALADDTAAVAALHGP